MTRWATEPGGWQANSVAVRSGVWYTIRGANGSAISTDCDDVGERRPGRVGDDDLVAGLRAGRCRRSRRCPRCGGRRSPCCRSGRASPCRASGRDPCRRSAGGCRRTAAGRSRGPGWRPSRAGRPARRPCRRRAAAPAAAAARVPAAACRSAAGRSSATGDVVAGRSPSAPTVGLRRRSARRRRRRSAWSTRRPDRRRSPGRRRARHERCEHDDEEPGERARRCDMTIGDRCGPAAAPDGAGAAARSGALSGSRGSSTSACRRSRSRPCGCWRRCPAPGTSRARTAAPRCAGGRSGRSSRRA